jgi:AraC-like DNA-binding protein
MQPAMTPGDNRMTSRATSSVLAEKCALPAQHLRVFLAAFNRLGYDTTRLTEVNGISQSTLHDPDAQIPSEVFAAVFALAMQQRPLKNLGVRLAAETQIGAFPLLDYLVITASTVGEGMKQLSHYFRLLNTPTSVEVRDQDEPIRVLWHGGDSFGTEFSIALSVLNLRRETTHSMTAERAFFAHRLDDTGEVEAILGCPVENPAPWSGIVFSRDAWNAEFRRRDPILKELLEVQAGNVSSDLPGTSPPSLKIEVRHIVHSKLAGGDISIDGIARELGLSSRTLQRRLADCGSSFEALLDEARRDAAGRYLSDASLSIAEIAYLLGYSEASALHRAFKRWNGVTPQEFRRNRP